MIIKGSAFLWHQVRCMVSVLFLIGQGLESPSVSKFFTKPLYG
jgi:tRNA pseudouridine38/39 synthase